MSSARRAPSGPRTAFRCRTTPGLPSSTPPARSASARQAFKGRPSKQPSNARFWRAKGLVRRYKRVSSWSLAASVREAGTDLQSRDKTQGQNDGKQGQGNLGVGQGGFELLAC